MITEDVGKLILSTQGEVKKFKDQLVDFARNNIAEGFLKLIFPKEFL